MKRQNISFVILLLSVVIFSTSFSYISAQESNVILFPTDDAYVAIDTNNLDDNITDLNTGDFGALRIAYSFNATGTEQNIVSLGHLKFDLSELNLDEIKSATLNLNAISHKVQNNVFPVFKALQNDWDESSLTFKTKPASDPVPIDVANSISSTNWVQWDVTDAIKQNNSTDITFVISLGTLKQNSQEGIIFHSKESTAPNSSPFLELEFIESKTELISELNISKEYTIKKLPVIDDAYVVNNFSDSQDTLQLQKINTGNLNFTKIWYSFNATGSNEMVATMGFLKFDLSELVTENILEANLKMYNFGLNTSGADKKLAIFSVTNSTWTESELDFTNKPKHGKEITFTEINTINDWVSWNVTDTVKQNTDPEITFALLYADFFLGHEEQVLFNSKESSNNTPYLEIVYDESENGGGCLIATATYGSELAPQVQQLRELRDNYLLQTESGSAFIESFNSIYYSFSPGIADLERQSPIFKEIVKLTITPLVSSLSILNYVDMDSESSVLGYGISIILLNVGMYFVAPTMLFWSIKNHIKKN